MTSDGTIIHPLRFLFLYELKLTMVFSKTTPLLPVLIKDSNNIMCPRALWAQADQFLHLLSAGSLAIAYKIGGEFHPVCSTVRICCILDVHPGWVRRSGIERINQIPPCEIIENFGISMEDILVLMEII